MDNRAERGQISLFQNQCMSCGLMLFSPQDAGIFNKCSEDLCRWERSVPEPLTDQQAGAFPLFIMGLCSFSSVSHDRFLNAFMFASAV